MIRFHFMTTKLFEARFEEFDPSYLDNYGKIPWKNKSRPEFLELDPAKMRKHIFNAFYYLRQPKETEGQKK